MIECVANVSTCDAHALDAMSSAVIATGADLLDVHTDVDHNRAVLTSAGHGPQVGAGAVALAACCLDLVDIAVHAGVHPRLGALDVCPFVPLGFADPAAALDAALAVAEGTAAGIAALGIPVFAYERLSPDATTLPQVRRDAFAAIGPSWGPPRPHPRAGATAVGVRDVLVAFNFDLEDGDGDPVDVSVARAVAAAVRESNGGPPGLRALGLTLARQQRVQVSTNITRPWECGIGTAWHAVDAAAARHGAHVVRGELVGLAPAVVFEDADASVLERCAVTAESSLEAALAQCGLRDAGDEPLRVPVLPR